MKNKHKHISIGITPGKTKPSIKTNIKEVKDNLDKSQWNIL